MCNDFKTMMLAATQIFFLCITVLMCSCPRFPVLLAQQLLHIKLQPAKKPTKTTPQRRLQDAASTEESSLEVVLGYINQGQAKCNGHFHGISYGEPKISCKLVFRETPKQVGYISIYTYIQSYIYIRTYNKPHKDRTIGNLGKYGNIQSMTL